MKKLIAFITALIITAGLFAVPHYALADTSGAQILSDLSPFVGVHPRLLYTQADIDSINSSLADNDIAGARANVIRRANSYIGYNISASPADSEKLAMIRVCQELVMSSLCEAYLLTGDSRYADSGIAIMDNMAQWSSLALSTENLITGHWSMCMAMGYDSFYNYLNETSAGRQKLQNYRNAIKNLPFSDTINAYKGRNSVARWITIQDNFSGVISGGVMALALAVFDESDFSSDISYLLEKLLGTNKLAASLIGADGGYFEGVSYSEYLLTNLSISTECLWHTAGTDYGIGNEGGFVNAGCFFPYMQTAVGVMNFSDCSSQPTSTYLPYWFGFRYGDKVSAQLQYIQNKTRGASDHIHAVYFYKKAMEGGTPDISGTPLDKYFTSIATGSFRSSHTSMMPTFAAFHAGQNGVAHDHLDLGEFVFESDGVKWAYDLGGDSYSLPNYFLVPSCYRIYRKKTEGENCLVINPAVNASSYYGQNTSATVLFSDTLSKPRGAYAVYDMTSAYTRDVTAYKRGFYFGDNRKTFTVQDELTLRSSGSELYWFMNTDAEINILSSGAAVLTQNGKRLRVELYTNASGAELLDMAQEPLPSSPVVSGQAVNTGGKLALHIPSASGSVQIAVKLIPQSAQGAEGLTFTPMESWTVPDGEIETDSGFSVITPTEGAAFCGRDVPVRICSPYAVPEAYFDGTRISLTADGDIYTGRASYAQHNLGNHVLTVTAGSDTERVNVETFASINGRTEYTLSNLGSVYNGSCETVEGSDGSADGGIRLIKGDASAFFLLSTGVSSQTVMLDLDVKKEDEYSGSFTLESKNGSQFTYMAEPTFISASGNIAGTSTVLPAGEWHNIRLIQELENNGAYRVYYDGILIKEAASEYDMTTLTSVKLQVNDGSICLDNIVFAKYQESPRIKAVKYNKGSGLRNASGYKISAAAQSIVLEMEPSFDALAVNVVNVNSKRVSNVTKTGGRIELELLEPLAPDSDCIISFARTLKSGTKTVGKKVDVRLLTNHDIAAEADSLPVTSEWTGRFKHFTAADNHGCYSPIGIWKDDGDNGSSVRIENGYLYLQKTAADSTLSWGDYLNGTYGMSNGFVTLPLEKLTADTRLRITFWQGINTELIWDRDGKLYAKCADKPVDGEQGFMYICDIDSLDCELTLYFYKDGGFYSIAVDGVYKKLIAYSAHDSANVQYICFYVDPGAVGDGIKVDYIRVGEITSVTDARFVSFKNTQFAGNDRAYALCDQTLNYGSGASANAEEITYAARYDGESEELKGVQGAEVCITEWGNIVLSESELELDSGNTEGDIIKVFRWDGTRPTKKARVYDADGLFEDKAVSFAPSVSVVQRNGLHWESSEGSSYGTIEITGSEGAADRTDKLIRGGDLGYMAVKSYCYGSYPHSDYAVMSFTLEKSSVEALGSLAVLPCDFVRFDWTGDGRISACFRESADQQGTDAKWATVYDTGSALSIDVTVAMNIEDSTYRMYINGECVIYDMYSRAVYAGQHSVPEKVEFIRIFSESGAAGQWFAIKNFKSGYGPGFGA